MAPPTLGDFQPLSPAEAAIVETLSSGAFDQIGDGLLPEIDDAEREVRASLLRFLILGGEEGLRPHEKGVRVSGAWIRGTLDLEGCRIPRDIGLRRCRFDAAPVLRSAIIDNLFLDGSALPGLEAERLEARGSLFLRAAATTAPIRLTGARLGGNLECDGLKGAWPSGDALSAEDLEAKGVLLRAAAIRGGVKLSGARLTADLNCSGASIQHPDSIAIDAEGIETRGGVGLRGARVEGEVRLQGARLGGDLVCVDATLDHPGRRALQLKNVAIRGAFFLMGSARVRGSLDLTGAVIDTLHDDLVCWPEKGDLLLNRCLYQAFLQGPADAESRLAWLALQSSARWGEDFWPQPYEQLASVFRTMGHDEDARAVLIEKERLQRLARRARADSPFWRIALRIKDAVLAATVLYGRQPLLAFVWLAGFWVLGAGVFAAAERADAIKPNSSVVLRSPEWTLCGAPASETRFLIAQGREMQGRAAPGQSQLACFRAQWEASSYPAFNPLAYSLETLVPILEMDQKQYWRPEPERPMGAAAMAYFYIQSVIGWALSLLAVAGFSGLVKSQ